jgi:hypothetical protein
MIPWLLSFGTNRDEVLPDSDIGFVSNQHFGEKTGRTINVAAFPDFTIGEMQQLPAGWAER